MVKMDLKLFLASILLVIYNVPLSTSYSKLSKCEVNRAHMCSDFYNETIFPNLAQHRRQDAAIVEIDNYNYLTLTKCSDNLRLFLCSLFIPVCTILKRPVPPCRSLCEEVKEGCETVLIKYASLKWPDVLDCSKFPLDEKDQVCIPLPKDNKKIRVPANKRSKLSDKEVAVLQCDEPATIVIKRLKHTQHGCSRSASLAALKQLCSGMQRCQFELKELVVLSQHQQHKSCSSSNVGLSYIKYSCAKGGSQQPMRKTSIPYGEQRQISCKGSSRHIVIHQVQLHDSSCLSPNAFCTISQRCTGLKSCNLVVGGSEISKHCRNKKSSIEVTYECARPVSEVQTLIANSLADVKLKCHHKQILSIVRAEFIGQPGCANKEVNCLVNLLCQNKNSCSIDVAHTTAVRCDTWLSTTTKTRIQYTCS